MKTLFSALFVAVFACVSFANEPTPADTAPPSVLVAPQAETPAVTAQQAVDDGAACAGDSCTTCRSSCRQGLFKRTIARTKTVTRDAVGTVVTVSEKIVRAPARVFRACRGNNCR